MTAPATGHGRITRCIRPINMSEALRLGGHPVKPLEAVDEKPTYIAARDRRKEPSTDSSSNPSVVGCQMTST